MEADHTAVDDPPECSEEVEKEEPGNWRKRLRIKQVAVQLPVMQKIEEGNTIEETEESQEKNKAQTARKSFKKPPLRDQDTSPGASISGKILRFSCSECTGQATFSPNDLLKHFQGVHQGSLPTFPCDMCSFVTHDFSSLQRHRIGHRDTFVRCEICNDGVQYTLLQLTRHFNMFHSLNGYYRCEKCKFSTKDVGTFVQHTHRHNDAQYKCSKCQHISHGSVEHQKHILTHGGTYPFSCHLCDFGAPRKDYVAKHMATVHGEEMDCKNKRRTTEDSQKTLVNSSPGLKLLLTKNPARQTHWMSKGLHALSGGGLLDEYGRLANPEKTLEETQQFLETVAAQRDCKTWAKALKTEQQYASHSIPALSQPKQEPAVPPSSGFLSPNSNGLTVLMVKNKITIPPNCTTKVMGFKMVDGKKHLVLKVIPSAKQEPSTKTQESSEATASASSATEQEADSQVPEPCTEESNSLASSKKGTGPPSGHMDSSNSLLSANTNIPNPAEASSNIELSSNTDPSSKTEVSSITEASFKAKVSSEPEVPSEPKDCSTPEASSNPDVSDPVVSSDPKDSPQPEVSSNAAVSYEPKVSPNPKVSSNIEDSPNGAAALCSPCLKGDTSTMEKENDTSASVQTEVKENGEQEHEMLSPARREAEEVPSEQVENDKDPALPLAALLSSDSACPVTEESSSDGCKDHNLPTSETPSHNLTADGLIFENKMPEFANLKEMDPSSNTPENIDEENTSSKSPLSSPIQEVFTFHNYSKDTSSLSSDASLLSDDQLSMQLVTGEPENNGDLIRASPLKNKMQEGLLFQELQDDMEDEDDTVAECNSALGQTKVDSDPSSVENVPDSEIEVDECIANVDDETAEQSEVTSQTMNIPKTVQEATFESQEQQNGSFSNDGYAETTKEGETKDSFSPQTQLQTAKNVEGSNAGGGEKTSGSSSNAAILGKILEEHSDAIISQQLEKERNGTTATQEAIRTPTTTLRILQPVNLADGKQQLFLQTAENGYAVPLQLKGSPGFKLITGSVPPINVSYLKPGGERPSNRTAALAFTLNNGRIGTAAHVLGDKETGGGLTNGGGQDSTTVTPGTQQGTGTSTSSFLVNNSPLKGPLLLSSPIQSVSKERTGNVPTCFLVQRPLAVASGATRPSTTTATSSSHIPQSRPVLALPVNSPDQPTVLQAGRQAFLLRYVSPVKSGILLNSPEGKLANQNSPTSESGASRVFLKIVRNSSDASFPSCSGVTGGGVTTQAHSNQQIYLAAAGSLQSPYLLMSSNQSILNVSAGTKTSESSQDPVHTLATASPLLSLSSTASTQGKAPIEKDGGEVLAGKFKKARLPSPRRNHQVAKRKRPRKPSMEDSLEPVIKTKRLSSKKSKEKEAPVAVYWEPAPRESERTLRLLPLSPSQLVKCPRRNQPVVVLNHPDADIPEVANLMRTVNKFRGEVMKVALSQRTVDALSELDCCTYRQDRFANCHTSHSRRVRPQGTVRERFILKLRLKKTSKNKYKVVNPTSDCTERSSKFSCWFCGRVFDNQEEWIGHGQRHLMEATRDWNKLF